MKKGVPAPLRIAKMFLGAILLVLGLVALVTPFTPGAWLIFVGLELLGIRFIVWGPGTLGRYAKKVGLDKFLPTSFTTPSHPTASDTSRPPAKK